VPDSTLPFSLVDRLEASRRSEGPALPLLPARVRHCPEVRSVSMPLPFPVTLTADPTKFGTCDLQATPDDPARHRRSQAGHRRYAQADERPPNPHLVAHQGSVLSVSLRYVTSHQLPMLTLSSFIWFGRYHPIVLVALQTALVLLNAPEPHLVLRTPSRPTRTHLDLGRPRRCPARLLLRPSRVAQCDAAVCSQRGWGESGEVPACVGFG
jgi:hypothetical protein